MKFNDPEFLSAAVHYGLLKGTASLHDAYRVMGILIGNEMLRAKRLAIKGRADIGAVVDALATLNETELRMLQDHVELRMQ